MFAYIKFLTDDDYAAGFEILRKQFTIGIEQGVICIPIEGLELLDSANICYVHAADEVASSEPQKRRTWRITASTPVPSS